jgi:hypothetical protein
MGGVPYCSTLSGMGTVALGYVCMRPINFTPTFLKISHLNQVTLGSFGQLGAGVGKEKLALGLLPTIAINLWRSWQLLQDLTVWPLLLQCPHLTVVTRSTLE